MPVLFAIAFASTACIARVSDGDTVRLCNGEKVRLIGIDAPELEGSPRCSAGSRARLAASRNPSWCNYAKGERAKVVLARFLAAGTVEIERRGQDAFGRTLARLTVNGKEAGSFLIDMGLARRWK